MFQTDKSKQALAKEDLAIQDTLQMSEEERLDLLVSLVVDKIIEDDKSDGALYAKIKGLQS
jgi:hypothetical protein